MENKTMLYVTIVLFAITAMFGVRILIGVLSNKKAPRPVVYSHGLFAATSLVLLIVYAFQNPANYPKVSIILFVLAALGGFYMFYHDINDKPLPKPVPFIHALIAVSGFIVLLLFVFGQH
jgi:hypothetical protein